MKLKNYTPFSPFTFASRDQNKKDFGVMVLQGSFDIIHDAALKPHQKQADMVFDDQYLGDIAGSSLVQENSVAPFKPKTDIHLNATAYAPEGKPRDKWLVSVKVGKIEKQLLITGPRCWERSLTLTKQLDDPEPITKLPIHYEYAYGGAVKNGNNQIEVYAENPVGKGFEQHRKKNPSAASNIAPQIIRPDEYDMDYHQQYTPQGFGPISPAWSPRLKYAGTYDLVWEKTRWPDLPEDFQFEFYNSAHPDLIYPGYVDGNEVIELRNLTPDGYVKTQLPGYEVAILVRYTDGELRPIPMMLDTVYFDVNTLQAFLTWRAIYSLEKDIRVLEARIHLPRDQSVKQSNDDVTVRKNRLLQGV